MSSWPASRGGEAVADSLIEGERAPTHALTDAADHDRLGVRPAHRSRQSALSMAGIRVGLAPTFEDRVDSNQSALIQDADLVGQLVHFDDATRTIGNAVVVAADRHQPVVADAPFEL